MDTSALLHEKLSNLSRNLWWTWHPEVIAIFREIDPEYWRRVNHNPIAFLQDLSTDKLSQRLWDTVMQTHIDHACRDLNKYLSEKYPWCATHAPVLRSRPVAYFSAEFGIHESLPIYSGGLGVLAGDHLKSASDLGLPMIGIGLLYREGYFHQRVNADGWQEEEYYRVDIDRLPLQRVKDAQGQPLIVNIETRRRNLRAMLWEAQVGRARLLLLDIDFDESQYDAHDIRRLYGGDERTRIEQELVLGIGGMRALRMLGINPGVLHLNEGHCAFAPLELARQLMSDDGLSFTEAVREATARVVFTTHTPVEAGHDRFSPELVEEVLGKIRDEMNLEQEELLALGRINPDDNKELFCMTVLALRLSRRANAVSAIHGRVSRKMWQALYPHHREDEVPISHITNGVHSLSWVAHEMYELFARTLGQDWPKRLQRTNLWEQVDKIDDAELWEIRRILKSKLITFARQQLAIQVARYGMEFDSSLLGQGLDPNILTIGFSRRFARYKRANLLISDPE
ncbi:MAG: alpha-glucan family phosphorylase, partial [Acidobacteriota bacterium]